MKFGRKSRKDRVFPTKGKWSILSNELQYDIKQLLNLSHENHINGRIVPEPIFAIPLIFSCIRITAIEIENYKEWNINYKSELLPVLQDGSNTNDILDILKFYKVEEKLKQDFRIAIEVRNEIIHPSPYPDERGRNLPEYFNYLEKKQVLWKPPDLFLVHNIFSNFKSHALFEWVIKLFMAISKIISNSHPQSSIAIESYKEYYDPKFWFNYNTVLNKY